jgi:hypothetical protein
VSERELPVARSAKKPKVKERTIAERKYCAIDQFYYSEMFTCPICYGADRERERIIEMLETEKFSLPRGLEGGTTYIPIEELIALIKGEQK